MKLAPTDRPVDALAARVVAPGIHWDPKKKIIQRHWDAPPSMRPIPRGVPNLVGVKFGRLTVVGLFTEAASNGTGAKGIALWVVRCSCGSYETRRGKSVRNPNNSVDACDKCRHLLHLQDRHWSVNRRPAAPKP